MLNSQTCMNASPQKTSVLAETLKEKSDYSLYELGSALGNVFPPQQEEKRALFAEEFFRNLSQLAKTRDSEFLDNYTTLAPLGCNEKEQALYIKFIKANRDLVPALEKNLLEMQDLGQRCIKIRAAYAAKSQHVAR